jgi:hypothetical protein
MANPGNEPKDEHIMYQNRTPITIVLSKDFIRLVLLSIVIASPVAWYEKLSKRHNSKLRVTH